jgi:hypothetical protein
MVNIDEVSVWSEQNQAQLIITNDWDVGTRLALLIAQLFFVEGNKTICI